MSDREFDGLWRATEAPAREIGFALAVDERIARRRMQIDIAIRFAAAAAVLAGLLALWPVVLTRADALVISLDAAGPALATAAVLTVLMAWLTREPADAWQGSD